MYQANAQQYGTPCVVIEEGDKSGDIIRFAKRIGAVTLEGRDQVLVIKFPRRDGPECYTESAIARSLRKRYVRKTAVTGVSVTFFTEEEVPDSEVTSVGGEIPAAGWSITVCLIRFGDQWIEAFSVLTS